MKIASWNVNSLNVRMPHMAQRLGESQPNVDALQETMLEDSQHGEELAGSEFRKARAIEA
jgi:exonuclease III